jgi:hypothetical protein
MFSVLYNVKSLYSTIGIISLTTLICICFPLQDKYFKCDKHGHEFEESMNELKILPSSVFHMPYDENKEYTKELHLLSDKYLATLQRVLEKLSSHLESQHSS